MVDRKRKYLHALKISFLTFILAIIVTFTSDYLVKKFENLYLAFTLLALIVTVHILFDIIGIAATAAKVTPFNAKCANKVKGAYHSLQLVKNADKVANICNDVIGDITGTVGGILGAIIVVYVVKSYPHFDISIGNTLMAGVLSAVTVGGKALGKTFAIKESTQIIFVTGKFLAWLEEKLGIVIIKNTKKKPRY